MSEQQLQSADVAVIGGGPAGCGAAMALLESGCQVVLIDRPKSEPHATVEIYPAEVQGPLSELGLWDAFLRCHPEESNGVVSLWNGQLVETDSITSPWSSGWAVRREVLDQELKHAFVESGGMLLEADYLGQANRQTGRCTFNIKQGPHEREFDAACLIDATGRSSRVARSFGAKQIALDRAVALSCCVRVSEDSNRDSRLFLESAENGWWYSIRVSSDTRLIVLMTDTDIIRNSSGRRAQMWFEFAKQTEMHGELIDQAPRSIQTIPAKSAFLDRFIGPNWLAVGDAAVSQDPLSGKGVLLALHSAVEAVPCVASFLAGADSPFFSYEAFALQWSLEVSTLGLDIYAAETRWPHAPYWQRRHELSQPM